MLAERIRAINPACEVLCIEDFISTENMGDLIRDDMDWVVDCIDSFRVKAPLIAHCRRNKIRCLTVGGAGGQIDPCMIRVADLSRTEQDPLLAKTRKLLRTDHGFSRNLKRRFGVPAVYSTEQARLPRAGGSCALDELSPTTGLNCAGFGAATHVTASFGLVAVGHVLNRLVDPEAAAQR